MHYTLEALIQGNPNLVSWYQAAAQHWEQVLRDINPRDAEAVSQIAEAEQDWFEQNCGGRTIGQEIMVVSAIARYYSTAEGWGDNLVAAKAMYTGLSRSMCSIEIHAIADEVANAYSDIKQDDNGG